MSTVVVGMADCKASQDESSVLVTYALGSCVAVAIYDRVARVGGLLHFMLPDSSIDPAKARERPYMFADTGIPLLFREAYRMGADKRRLRVRLAGGAQVMDDAGIFNIGKRNCLAARKILWKAGVLVEGEEVGGNQSRTVRLEVSTGALWLRGPGAPEREMAAAPLKGAMGWRSES